MEILFWRHFRHSSEKRMISGVAGLLAGACAQTYAQAGVDKLKFE